MASDLGVFGGAYMAILQNWNNTKLQDYLLFDYWLPYQGWCILAGLDTGNKDNFLLDFDLELTEDEKDAMEVKRYKNQLINNVDRLREFWLSGQNDDVYQPPAYFIEWALSKRFRPDWLDWAIEKKLYIPSSKAEIEGRTNIFDKNSATYPPELDLALQAWQAVSNNNGKGKPKARIKKWLDINTTELSNEAKERISIVANWDKLGGATRTD